MISSSCRAEQIISWSTCTCGSWRVDHFIPSWNYHGRDQLAITCNPLVSRCLMTNWPVPSCAVMGHQI